MWDIIRGLVAEGDLPSCSRPSTWRRPTSCAPRRGAGRRPDRREGRRPSSRRIPGGHIELAFADRAERTPPRSCSPRPPATTTAHAPARGDGASAPCGRCCGGWTTPRSTSEALTVHTPISTTSSSPSPVRREPDDEHHDDGRHRPRQRPRHWRRPFPRPRPRADHAAPQPAAHAALSVADRDDHPDAAGLPAPVRLRLRRDARVGARRRDAGRPARRPRRIRRLRRPGDHLAGRGRRGGARRSPSRRT